MRPARSPSKFSDSRFNASVAMQLGIYAELERNGGGSLADRRTLTQEDLDTLVDILRIRPIQFCMFLAALFGEEQMEKMMSSSVQQVKTLRANRRKSLGREPELGEE